MDFLKKGQEMFNQQTGGNSSGGAPAEGSAAPQGGAAPAQNAGTEDYGDKGLDFIEKKSGHTFSRDQNEKVTDGARSAYEKFSGSKVDAKYSN